MCSDAVENDLVFLGLIVFENKLKPETAPIVRELHDADIRIVMVTGTSPVYCWLSSASTSSLPYSTN